MKSRKDIALALIKKEDVSNSYLHIFFQFVFSVNYYSHPGLLGASSGFNADFISRHLIQIILI